MKLNFQFLIFNFYSNSNYQFSNDKKGSITSPIRLLSNPAFTVIEILIAVGLTVVVMMIAFGFWRFFTQNMQISFDENALVQDAQQVSAQLVREIREMKESETGGYPLEITNDQELVFYANVDADAQIERVRYVLESGQFKRGIIDPVGSPATYPTANESIRIVTEGIANGTNPIFVYYNGDWPGDTINNPLPDASRRLQARMIKIQLTIQNTSQEGARSIQITRATALRAVKTN